MKKRRLPLLLVLIALLIAPFGRMGMAEAAAAPHHRAPTAMAGHCADMPAPAAPDLPDTAAIDCTIACAAITPGEAPLVAGTPPAAPLPGAAALATFRGIHAGTDPPPPRSS